MARKLIPASLLVTCDACGKQWSAHGDREPQPNLIVVQYCVDYQGNGYDNSLRIELCDGFLSSVSKAVEKVLADIRGRKP